MTGFAHVAGQINLQATLSAASAAGSRCDPHHPITCTGQLGYLDDGSLECEHARVGPDDERLRFCLDHTIAILILEEAVRRFNGG